MAHQPRAIALVWAIVKAVVESLTRSWPCLTVTLPLPTALGVLPPAGALASVPIFSAAGVSLPTLLTTDSISTHDSHTGPSAVSGIVPASHPDQAVVLSSALPPISAMAKFRSGQYVSMKDLLVDNPLRATRDTARTPPCLCWPAEAQTARDSIPSDMDVVFLGVCLRANA